MGKTDEYGRSMVEMLGVLAVTGVLSVAGVAGFSYAMNRHKANELMEFLSRTTALTQAQALLGNLSESVIQGNIDQLKGSHVATAVVCSSTSSGATTGTRYAIHVTNIPKGVCEVVMQQVDSSNHYAMKSANVYVGADGCTKGTISCTSDESNAISFIFEPDDYVAPIEDPCGSSRCSCQNGSCSIVNNCSTLEVCGEHIGCIGEDNPRCTGGGHCEGNEVWRWNGLGDYQWSRYTCGDICTYITGYSDGVTCAYRPTCVNDRAFRPFTTNPNWSTYCYKGCVTDPEPHCETRAMCQGNYFYPAGNTWSSYYCDGGCLTDPEPHCAPTPATCVNSYYFRPANTTWSSYCPKGCVTDPEPHCETGAMCQGSDFYPAGDNGSIYCYKGCVTDPEPHCETEPMCRSSYFYPTGNNGATYCYKGCVTDPEPQCETRAMCEDNSYFRPEGNVSDREYCYKGCSTSPIPHCETRPMCQGNSYFLPEGNVPDWSHCQNACVDDEQGPHCT